MKVKVMNVYLSWHKGRPYRLLPLLLVGVSLLWGCSNVPESVEVTRLVSQEVPVTVQVSQVETVEVPVEVTVEVPVEVTVEVPVEVTRLVEVMVTPTVEALISPTVAVTPTATAEAASTIYTVQAGDTLATIAAKTGSTVAEITAANNLNSQSFLSIGQELGIPGWDGVLLSVPTVISSTPVPTTAAGEAQPTAVIVTTNLLPNPSFEADWYFFNSINELQIPNGWSVSVDEGPNTLSDDPDDVFFRPEIRVVPSSDLPASERSDFIFEGNKTIKAFKGGAPTNFALFTDIALPAGSYRFTVRFFPDIVSVYQEGKKVWATDPLAAEMRFILNEGGTNWTTTPIASQNTMTYDFTLAQATTVRLGAAFRNRYVNNNNGWFIDDWSLHQVAAP